MKVDRDLALKVCQAVGLKSADKWDNKRLAQKMESLPDMKKIDEVGKSIKDKETKNLLSAILDALENGKTLTITDDEKPAKGKAGKKGKAAKAAKKAKDTDDDEDEDEDSDDEDEEEDSDEDSDEEEDEAEDEDEDSDEDEDEDESDEDEDEDSDDEDEDEEEEVTKPKKTGKKGKAAAKASKNGKPKKAKKAEVEKDKWGFRTNTRTARINAAIYESSKPLSVKEIEKKAKAHSIHSHLGKLRERGLVRKDDEGKYRVAKSKK